MAAGSTTVVLGGGTGGLVLAQRLRRRLPSDHRVILVDRSTEHHFAPSFLWVVMGQREPRRIIGDLRAVSTRGVELILAEVQRIDPAARRVETSTGPLPYDHLVIALGAALNPAGIPGFPQSAEQFYDLKSAVRLRDRLAQFGGGKILILIARTPFRCPAAPYEAALLLEDRFRRHPPAQPTKIDIYTPEPLPMPVAGPVLGRAVVDLLTQRGIGFHPQHKVTAIDPGGKRVRFEDGSEASYDLLIGIPPHEAPAAAKLSGLTNESGYIPVDPHTLQTAHPDVYALGDIAAIKLPSGMMLPKAGVFAHGQAEALARSLAAKIRGRGTPQVFDGRGYCFLEAGSGKAGFASGAFYASPVSAVKLRRPGRLWHWGKILFEWYWLWKWF